MSKKDRIVSESPEYKKWLLSFGLFVGIIIACIFSLVIYIDPFFQYHEPLEGFPYLIDNQLSQNPGMAKNFEYDSVMLGSSVTANFNTEWFEELYQLNLIKLPYNGAYPKDQANILGLIFKEQPEVKKIFLGVDIPSYSGEVNETKYPIPEYLYDSNLVNDVKYILNKNVVLNYILRPLADPKDKTNLSQVYKLWFKDEYYDEKLVIDGYIAPDISIFPEERDTYILNVKKNLDKNIIPFIEAHPETEFVVFYPPYSILYWYGIVRENKLEATLREYQYIAERLLEYKNVEMYSFVGVESIVTDLNNYADYTHYHERINYYMAESFGSKQNRITSENLNAEISKLRKIASEFEYEELFVE